MHSSRPSSRLTFPEAEARLPWLATLLEMYALSDRGVAEAIRRQEVLGRRLACGPGCAACCRCHLDIPVYPLELTGIYWYVLEETQGPQRVALQENLAAYRQGEACPFLLDDTCGIHPMRPMACRNFNVFGRPCAEGEDAFHSRRGDVLDPPRESQRAALERMLVAHGVRPKAARRARVRSGQVHVLAQVLQKVDWRRLAARMEGGQGSGPGPEDPGATGI